MTKAHRPFFYSDALYPSGAVKVDFGQAAAPGGVRTLTAEQAARVGLMYRTPLGYRRTCRTHTAEARALARLGATLEKIAHEA